MAVDPVDAVNALGMLADPLPRIQEEVQMAVLKRAIDSQVSQALSVVQSLEPNIGRNVDVKI